LLQILGEQRVADAGQDEDHERQQTLAKPSSTRSGLFRVEHIVGEGRHGGPRSTNPPL
jgi:hypothetical protein